MIFSGFGESHYDGTGRKSVGNCHLPCAGVMGSPRRAITPEEARENLEESSGDDEK